MNRIAKRIAIGLVGLVVLLAGTGYGLYVYYDSRVTRISLPSLGKTTTSATAAKTVATGSYFLLAGSDTRDLSDGTDFQSGSDAVTGQRADTVILVHLPAGAAKATVVSFPRDSYVTIPSYTSSKGVTTAAHKAKLNEAFALGGADLLVKTIESITGLPIDHYLQVNFDGFRRIVNAIGGVTLCIGTTRDDKDSGDQLTAGVHSNVSGNTALAFVRDRKGVADGDLSRIADQQYFLAQVLHKVLSAGTLANPVKVASLLNATTSALTVDKDFGLAQIKALASHLSSLDSNHVTFLTLPITTDNGRRTIHGLSQSVVLLDDSKLATTFAELAGTPTHATSASPTASSTATPQATQRATPTATATAGTTASALSCAV